MAARITRTLSRSGKDFRQYFQNPSEHLLEDNEQGETKADLMIPKTTQSQTLLGLNLVPLLAWLLLGTLFVALHLAVEPLLAAFLVTILFALFTGLCLFCFLYVFLLVKNRSFWHNAVIDDDPIIARSIRAFFVLIGIFYVIASAWKIYNYVST